MPFRGEGAGFGATLNAIVPSPWPLPLPLIVTHATFVAAAHEQSRAAVTATVALPPDASNEPGALADT